MECLNGLTKSLQIREEIEEESKKKFEIIVSLFNEMVEKATMEFTNKRLEELNQANRVLRQWELKKRDLSSEIGIWANRWVKNMKTPNLVSQFVWKSHSLNSPQIESFFFY